MSRVARILAPVALFALLTAVMTWPQVTRLSTDAYEHQDVYFNMWRFAWVAHALSTSPSHLLDGNIFYPEPRTLTFSDAMPVESTLAAPLLWAGLPQVLVHNIMLLGGMVLSSAGIFVLARRLTGSSAAAFTAGIVFGFAPYRFEHYMHMELQWTVWIPWAFWALHRAFETGERRYGALIGLFVALQFMSSVYYGVFLATLLAVVGVFLLCGLRRQRLKNGAIALAVGGALSAALVLPYALPYATTRSHVGGRSESQVLMFSAKPSSYTVATETNYLYGDRAARRGRPERRLFTGVLPLLLAVTGLLLRRPANEALAYLVGAAVAFEMSLGLYGYSYAFLYHHVSIFDGLRAPARLGVLVLFFVALLAAYGHAAIAEKLPRAGRQLLAGAICGLLILEYWVAPLPLVPYPNHAPPLYAWLAQQPRGVVAEFPMPLPDSLPGDDPRYAFLSTFDWMPSINGYSGYYPPSYLERLVGLRHFPSVRATAVLKRSGVEYVIVHLSSYTPDHAGSILAALESSLAFIELGRWNDGQGAAAVFRLR